MENSPFWVLPLKKAPQQDLGIIFWLQLLGVYSEVVPLEMNYCSYMYFASYVSMFLKGSIGNNFYNKIHISNGL